MPTFVLPLEDIDENGKPWSFSIDPSWITSELADSGLRPTAGATSGSLEVTAQRMGDDILVRGRIRTAVACDCARCLEDAVIPVDVELTTLLMPESQRPKSDAREEDVDVDETTRDYYSGDEIVLDGLVRELIVLEEPMQPLCREDCPGIPIPEGVRPPADFGREEGVVDPRLAPLMKLKRGLARTEE